MSTCLLPPRERLADFSSSLRKFEAIHNRGLSYQSKVDPTVSAKENREEGRKQKR